MIIHVDINSYFATLLQQENPYLRGKPVGVLKGAHRTCVIAASKEAKALGVKAGCRISDAKKVAPQILLVPAEFDLYLDITKRLKKIFYSFSPDVIIYSLDEAFIDITGCLGTIYDNPWQVAKKIQIKIKAYLGEWVTCNVGISHNRLLAKIASEINRPDSILEINDSNQDAILATVRFSDVCGVGFRLERKLAALNIYHPYQVRFYNPQELAAMVGPFWAQELLKIAYGEEPHGLSIVDRNLYMKSVGRSITGYGLTQDELAIKRVLYNLMEEVTYKVRKMDMAGRYIWLKLYGHNRSWQVHRTLQYYIRHTKDMFQLLYYDLYRSWQRDFGVVKFAVRLGQLLPMSQISQSLLSEFHRQERISRAMDKISQKNGLFTVYSGLLHRQHIIRPEVTGFLGDKLYLGLR